MKKLIAFVLAFAMILSVAACGKTESNSGAANTPAASQQTETKTETKTEEKITLKWAIWDKDTTPYWQALVDAYKAKNPNVTVEMVDLGSSDYSTVLATQLSGNTGAFDVVTIKDVPGYATLVQKNTLESLDSYIKSANIDLKLYGGATDQVTVNGSLYELPFRNDFWVVFYNKDIFDKAGVAYPTNDMTFAEYDALAKKITSKEFGNEVYGTHYHTWRSAVQLFGVLDGKNNILSGKYDFFKPYYEMVLGQEKAGVCRSYTDLKTEGLHYSAAFSG
ncbi:MAG: extracellular solute-binding protein, partial [Lachnospiraceae bacterium]|nr:extracellular solute-binding protein [Lachnospiraceae bacterium]